MINIYELRNDIHKISIQSIKTSFYIVNRSFFYNDNNRAKIISTTPSKMNELNIGGIITTCGNHNGLL